MIKTLAGADLNNKIVEGVKKIADVVSVTLGPKGKTVIVAPIDRKPYTTKDGSTVAKAFSTEDLYENLGAQIAKEASQKSSDLAGDGSTTVVVLLNAMLQNAQKYLSTGANFVDIKNGIEEAIKYVIEMVERQSKPVSSKEDLFNIASISANNDPSIGKMIAEAIDSIGKDGSLLVENSKTAETILKIVEGFTFDSGFVSNRFITDERRQVAYYDDPLIFITDHKIENVATIMPILELAARDDKPLIIIADSVDGQALAALILNTIKGTMKVVAVRPPKFGQERRNVLEDLCVATGATYYSQESGKPFKDFRLTDFGRAKSIEIQRNSTIVVDGKGSLSSVQDKIAILKEMIRQSNDLEECKRIQERITRLASGVAIIYVGGSTEVEAQEKKFRVEDAIEACKSALESGIVAGGGTALYKISLEMEPEKLTTSEDERFGALVVQKSIREPFNKIVSNSGKSPEVVSLGCDFKFGFGYDANKDKNNVDMIANGIIDPTKVLLCALRHATSIVITIMSAEVALVET